MILRRWSLPLVLVLSLAACASRGAPPVATFVPAEALTNETTIRARCEDPDAVLAGRALCVLKDVPRLTPSRRPK